MNNHGHAIIGCGRIAVNHVDAFRAVEGVTLTHAVDIDAEIASGFAQTHGIAKAAIDIDAVLDASDVHSVSLCLPHFLYQSIAEKALARGKHVLMEKPCGLNGDEIRAIGRIASENGLVAMPVAQHRYDPLVISIYHLIQSGALGRIALVRGHLECQRPLAYYQDSPWRGKLPREGGSVLINQAYHILELILWLAGPLESQHANMGTLRAPQAMETEDTLTATLRFAGGAMGALTLTGAGGATWNSYIELIGTEGMIAFDINFPNRLHRFQLEDRAQMRRWRKRFDEDLAALPPVATGTEYYGVSHRDQARDFISHIRGEARVETGADLAHAAVVGSVIEQLYASAREA
ncbi:Gfo/Idh/MocA family oxidoreductase [Allorhizobium sp. BGMRC 0089]|uniref:Gfo/Idh/MocA family protein n=1 Tax=Allorhizobium sonneratiae TaxID=2934936 RepID=UPI0020347A9A|nr:Gfo/Idh/MocA family oxidoreductase [Allorhizobium sonneratiae]MCM2292395.1 Gfo/Idh/MocA family oxidoreductase [Allorhizobium sonneratiae]